MLSVSLSFPKRMFKIAERYETSNGNYLMQVGKHSANLFLYLVSARNGAVT